MLKVAPQGEPLLQQHADRGQEDRGRQHAAFDQHGRAQHGRADPHEQEGAAPDGGEEDQAEEAGDGQNQGTRGFLLARFALISAIALSTAARRAASDGWLAL